jgi:hypothetical protein
MNKETTLLEPELPQLRQMVQRNTERIDKHEMTINRMLMENNEQSRKISECDKWAERSRLECERWTKNMRKTLDEIAQISKESKEMSKETDRQMRETDKEIKEAAMEVKRLSRQLIGTTGHIIEGLVSSSVEKIFKEAGLELQNSGKNLKRKLKAENIAMEVDVLLSNEIMAVPIEVKTNFTKEDLHHFLHQMSLFRRLFTDCSDKKVVAAVAAINYERGVAELAHKEGLLVIRVNSDDIFSLDPFEEKDLRQF